MTKRPEKLFWVKCNCGSEFCDKQYPTNLGSFYQGTGFDTEEREWLDAAWAALKEEELNDEPAHRLPVCMDHS